MFDFDRMLVHLLRFHEFSGVDISTRLLIVLAKFENISKHRIDAATTKLVNKLLNIIYLQEGNLGE